jgi:hypothetical protein
MASATVRTMLSNFEQTLKYYRQLARRPGGFPAVLLAPREKEIAEAPTGLGLPKTYLDFARKHIVEDVSLGALDLMPFVSGDIFEALSLANGDYRNLLIGESFVHVANYEGDLILLHAADPAPQGQRGDRLRDPRQGGVHEPRPVGQGPRGAFIIRDAVAKGTLRPAAPSSRAPPAIPASAWRWWARRWASRRSS